ncbi:diguanylate cyclase domain-containing protein [Actinoplanes sp. URMC 104]|uniref:diguanylate cyclase domain-containing protein n=1 Tax=Actinoplanes sp. URMC 104 TaxID=3423409 RepID=UPI003F1C119F
MPQSESLLAAVALALVLAAVLAAVVRTATARNADLRALRRSVAREHVLGEAGTALLSAADRAEVHRIATRAAGTLLAECPGARASVVDLESGEFTLCEASGERTGRSAVVTDAPASVTTRLRAGEVVVVDDLAALGFTDLPPATRRPYTLLPLTNGDRFLGVLSVSAEAELPAEVSQALQALRTQVALALAGVALTAELTDRALRDPLTGLGNRAMLHDRLAGALARSRRTGRPVGALLLDLNGFKQVNDAHGHTAGDRVLRVVADRLRECVRIEDTVSRLGGDEFVVVVEDLSSARDALVVAERIVAALDRPVEAGGRRLRTPASVGIALSHAGIDGPDELLRLADTAMYEAKRRGGGGFHLHGARLTQPKL